MLLRVRGNGVQSPEILVTGATGTVGRHVVGALSRSGVPVRASCRRPGALGALSGVEPVPADLERPQTLRRALEGAATLFLSTPLEERMIDRALNVVEEARRAGVAHVVRLSAFGAGRDGANTLGRVHRSVETGIEASGMAWTMLRPNSFMQNYVAFAGPTIAREGAIHMPQGEGAVSMVDARDVADAAVAALLEPGHHGAAYELTGPQALSNGEVAEILSAALGRSVRYVDVAESATREALSAAGLGPWLTGIIMELYAMSKTGEASQVIPDLADVLRRSPTTFARFAADHREAFA